MITVTILINNNPILTRSGYRISGNESEVCQYHIDDGSVIEHNYNDGAVELAKKMLDTIKTKVGER